MILPSVSVIILNWNGFSDTIECLKSLQMEAYVNKNIIVVDNGSTDNSVELILEWLIKCHISVCVIDNLDENGFQYISEKDKSSIYIIKNKRNLGFAAGNNVGIRFALFLGSKYVALLNNDTVVTPSYLTSLISFLETNRVYKAVSSLILYYDNMDIVWYGGARIFSYMYLRKYIYINKNIKEVSNVAFDTSLVTGCSLAFEPLRVGFLSEDFFYGEEDYEFSLRIIKQRYKLACIPQSIVYHKVGRSIKPTEKRMNKICLYYINRFVHLKRYYANSILWHLAIIPQCFYVFLLLFFRDKVKFSKIILLLKEIYKRSRMLGIVSQRTFVDIMRLKLD